MCQPLCASLLALIILVYIAVCFGIIAKKHGKNPILHGILLVISPINLIILGYWAFSKFESRGEHSLNSQL
jgi:hypothetical protein